MIILGFLNFGGWEIILIIVVVLLLFGGKRIPELAKGCVRTIKEFKKAGHELNEGREELRHQERQALS
jgi:TatA/E family protein of Tat protein translocase